MSSKVIVNIPSDPFQQIKKKQPEIVETDRTPIPGLTSADPVVRANQLEQNIRFLQEQHQIMLTGLHKEIEILRQKNRDLQFQIVFSNGVNLVQGSPSSDEEFQRNFPFSPGHVNITPLQIEILERNIAELRTNLSEARTRNVYLQNVIDEQKKKITVLEREKLDLIAVGKKIGKENLTSRGKFAASDPTLEDLQEKLEDADRLIRRLRRENEDQRKEIVSLRTPANKGKFDGRRTDGNNGTKSYYRNGQTQGTRFPPLHGQPHWRHKQNSHFNYENPNGLSSEREGDHVSGETEVVGRAAPTLPYLRDRNNASTSSGYSNPTYSNYQTSNHKRGFYYHRKQEDHRSNGRPSRRDQNHPHNDR